MSSNRKIYKFIKPWEIHPTIDANYYKGPSHQRPALLIPSVRGGGSSGIEDKRNWDTYMINGKIRRLTPTECERLMSWPDDWTRWGTDDKGNKIEISDSQRYKMCGNGVVSNCIQAIVEQLIVNKKAWCSIYFSAPTNAKP